MSLKKPLLKRSKAQFANPNLKPNLYKIKAYLTLFIFQLCIAIMIVMAYC